MGLRSAAIRRDRPASGRTDTGNRSLRPPGPLEPGGQGFTAGKALDQKGGQGPPAPPLLGSLSSLRPRDDSRPEGGGCLLLLLREASCFHFHFQSEGKYLQGLNFSKTWMKPLQPFFPLLIKDEELKTVRRWRTRMFSVTLMFKPGFIWIQGLCVERKWWLMRYWYHWVIND